jgi:hypothetical protein
MAASCGSTSNATYPGNYAGWFALPNSSGQVVVYRAYASTFGTLTISSNNTSLAADTFAIASINNGGCVVGIRSSSNLICATYSAALAQTNSVTLVSNIGSDPLGLSGIPGGSFVAGYPAPTTGYASFTTAYSATYTNGVTLLTGVTSYTPSNGYYLLGVSLTTAAAGSTGMVATNGSANLFNTYPVLPSNILFDSTGTAFTARSAINAQRGNVIGTNVTLRGLE